MNSTNYVMLNELAESNGIVIFGGESDLNIPIGELRQAFDIRQKIYNRSTPGLSVKNAAALFDKNIAPIMPETVLLHIGEADIDLFEHDSSEFDNQYRELLCHIKSFDKKCRIAVVSLKNHENNIVICEMNRHLNYIADSENCEFEDITGKKVWNPQNTKDISFIYSIGFVRPLNIKRPLYDLVKMIFCFE